MATNITYKGSELASFSNNTKTLKTAGKYLEGDITVTNAMTITALSVTPSETTQTFNANDVDGYKPVSVAAITSTYVGSSVTRNPSISKGLSYDEETNIISNHIVVQKGYFDSRYAVTSTIYPHQFLPTQETATIIPSESAQTAVDIHKWTTGTVTVAAITPTYVGSGITTQNSLTVNANTITANAGYYANTVTYTMPYATARPMTLTQATPSINVDSTGLVTATNNKRKTIDIRGIETAGYAKSNSPSFEVTQEASSATYQLPTLPAQTFTPSSSTQTVASTGKYMLGDITVQPIPSEYVVPTGTLTITHAGTTNVTNYANVDVPEARHFAGMNWGYTTQNNQRKFQFLPRTIVDPEEGGQAGWIAEGVYDGLTSTFSAVPSGITITPTQTTQTIGGTNYMMEGPVTVAAVTTGYLKGMLTMPTDIDFSTGHTPTATWTVEPSGMVIYQCYGSGSITNAVYSSGYIENTQQIPAEYEAGGSYQLPTQGATTVTPSETAQTLSVNQKYMTGNVTVAAITSTYVGSGIAKNPTITVSGPSVTIPAGYYSSQQTKTVASGSVDLGIEATVEALPTITVSASGLITALNNSTGQVEIEVNPGYISGNTTGTIGIAGEATRQLSTQGATTVTPSAATQTVNVTGKYMTGNVTVNPIPSQYIVPSGTLTITSVDTTTTFDATSYASVAVNLKNADVTAY